MVEGYSSFCPLVYLWASRLLRGRRHCDSIARWQSSPPPRPSRARTAGSLAPLLAFAVFSLTAGLLAAHDPRSKGYFRLFFSDPIHLKAGFATAAAVLACFQLFTAAWIFRKLPWEKPAWVNPVHRWSGRLAFAFTLPVAYHCIFKLGFQARRHARARSLAARLRRLRRLRREGDDRPAAPLSEARAPDRGRPALRRADRRLVHERASGSTARHAAAAPAKSSPIPAAANAAAGAQRLQDRRLRRVPHARGGGPTARSGRTSTRCGPASRRSARRSSAAAAAMPSFKGQLSADQIRDVAAFVAKEAG